MDKLDLYRNHIQQLLTKRAQARSQNDPIASQLVFDTERDHYQLVRTGWRDSNTRIYGCVLPVDIKGDKIWVQHDGTEDAIADQLAAIGVPKQDIVLAYHAPHLRHYTEFAID